MSDLLRGIKSLIEVRLALRVSPQHVPVVPICAHHAIQLHDEAYEFRLALEHLIETDGLRVVTASTTDNATRN